MLVYLQHLTLAMLFISIKTEINIYEKSLNTVFVELGSFVCSFFLSLGLISIIPGSKIKKNVHRSRQMVSQIHMYFYCQLQLLINTVPAWNLF